MEIETLKEKGGEEEELEMLTEEVDSEISVHSEEDKTIEEHDIESVSTPSDDTKNSTSDDDRFIFPASP